MEGRNTKRKRQLHLHRSINKQGAKAPFKTNIMDYLVEEYERHLQRIGECEEPCPTCGRPTEKDFCNGDCFEAYLM